MYRFTDNADILFCVETAAFIPRGSYLWPTEWLRSNEPLPALAAGPGFELHTPQHYRYIRDQAFAWMRVEAVQRGYDSIESCASYYNSSVTRYRTEARAMVAWRDAVNQALEQLVLAPPEGIETWEQVRSLLPQSETFAWPERTELPLDIDEKAVLP